MLQTQAEEYTSADAEVMELMDQHDKEKLNDPLAKLEHGNAVMARKKAQNTRLLDLRDDSADKYKNDYEMNKLLRKNLRYSFTVQPCFLLNFCFQLVSLHLSTPALLLCVGKLAVFV